MTTRRPRILVTVDDPATSSEPDIAGLKNDLYSEAVLRAGGEPRRLDARATEPERAAAFAEMAAVLFSGGPDVDPARYGRPLDGSREIDRSRDVLEEAAWDAAATRGLPVLGICRGLQVVNVFSGGTLTQHVDGHVTHGYGHGDPHRHELRLEPHTRLASLLREAGLEPGARVNSFHHQGVRADDLAPGLLAAGWSDSPIGPLVEALEGSDGRWLMAVQSHPERPDSTPPAFERLFAAFVEAAARGS